MYLDFAADEHGGYVLLDGPRFAAGVIGFGGYPLVSLRDPAVPRRRGMDVRTEGLWASITEETPGEHWSVGMEAFAVGYDDPARALTDELGDRVPLGFDLEWERAGELWMVHGDVLVGDSRFDIAWPGTISDQPPYRFCPLPDWGEDGRE